MTHLTDMEELLNSIISKNIANYMQEAMSCYMSGAYRGCIVLSYIALFDDLLAKLEELSKVNKKARKIFKEADKRKSDQQVFESYLIDQLNSEKLIPDLDSSFLDTLRVLRNKSAHPSGHIPSAEEARFIFYEVIKRFLSRPILSTTQLVDDIISKLKDKHFFPNTNIEDIKTVVEEEIESLHDEAIPQLIIKLINKFADDNATIKKNAGFFIGGLARLNNSMVNSLIQEYLITKKSSDANYDLLLIRVLSSNGTIYNGLNKTVRKRLKKIISNRIDSIKSSTLPTKYSHPVTFFASLFRSVNEDDLSEIFEEEFKDVVKKYFSTSSLIFCIKGKKVFKKYYMDIINQMAGSSNFDTANKFARSLPDIDKDLAKIITDRESFAIILNILYAAYHGAFGARDLRDSKFNPIPKLKKKSIKYCGDKPRGAKSMIKKIIYEDMSTKDFIDEYL